MTLAHDPKEGWSALTNAKDWPAYPENRVQAVTVSRMEEGPDIRDLMELTFAVSGKFHTYTLSKEILVAMLQAIVRQIK
jgi:hypothetical protein